jgi:hypothetical protein
VRLRLLPAYLKAVFRHGWWILLAVVGGVGDVATVLGDFPVPRWLWYLLIAIGVLAAQFGAHYDVRAELATVRRRLRELDTAEAKRAYIDACIQEARDLIEEVSGLSPPDWYGNNGRILADLGYWESGVRAEIRKAWGTNRRSGLTLTPKLASRIATHVSIPRTSFRNTSSAASRD